MDAKSTATDYLQNRLECMLYSITVLLAGRRDLPLVDAWIMVLTWLSTVIETVQEKLEQRGMMDPADPTTSVNYDIATDIERHVQAPTSGNDIDWVAAGKDTVYEGGMDLTATDKNTIQPKPPLTSTSITQKLRPPKQVLLSRIQKKPSLKAPGTLSRTPNASRSVL